MARAVTCPICYGKGKLDMMTHGLNDCGENHICHGCRGKGWVEISE